MPDYKMLIARRRVDGVHAVDVAVCASARQADEAVEARRDG